MIFMDEEIDQINADLLHLIDSYEMQQQIEGTFEYRNLDFPGLRQRVFRCSVLVHSFNNLE